MEHYPDCQLAQAAADAAIAAWVQQWPNHCHDCDQPVEAKFRRWHVCEKAVLAAALDGNAARSREQEAIGLAAPRRRGRPASVDRLDLRGDMSRKGRAATAAADPLDREFAAMRQVLAVLETLELEPAAARRALAWAADRYGSRTRS